jgi:hypothetical protein
MNYLDSLRLRAQIAFGAEQNLEKQSYALELCARGADGCIFFIENFCWTFDPRKNPSDLPFILYDYQKDYIRWVIEKIDAGEDALTDKSRDMGATYLVLCVFLWYWLFKSNSRFLVGSRKEDLVDGKAESQDDAPLFKKIEYNIDRLPLWLMPRGFRKDVHRTFLNLTNPENGSQISGESANPDFGRGGRYKAILLDEFSFWDYDTEAWRACSQSTPCRLPVSTAAPFGKFKRLRFGMDGEVIAHRTLLWSLHPEKTAEWYEREKKRSDPDTFAQEVDVSYETSAKGSVYGTEMKLVTWGHFSYEPGWPLYISHDPGLDDSHALGFWQIDPRTWNDRLLVSFERSGKIARWFLPFFGKPIDSQFVYTDEDLELIDYVKKWKAAAHVGDPAGKNRNQVTGTSVYDDFKEAGIYVQTNSKDGANEFIHRRAETKKLLMSGPEVDIEHNKLWKMALEQAHYPQRQETSQATSPIIKPVHDWTSHLRTMTEFYAVNRPKPEKEEDMPEQEEPNEDVY